MAYTKTIWEDLPQKTTPITASNLNNIEDGVEDIDTRLATAEGDITRNSTYSTSEIVVGTWIDGKPLYRKVVVYTNSITIGELNKVTDISIAHNISNFKQVCDCRIVTADGYILPTINSTNETTVTAGVRIHRVGTSAVVLRIINDTWGPKTWYITLMYTKTTD